jgi:hypothetical protein
VMGATSGPSRSEVGKTIVAVADNDECEARRAARRRARPASSSQEPWRVSPILSPSPPREPLPCLAVGERGICYGHSDRRTRPRGLPRGRGDLGQHHGALCRDRAWLPTRRALMSRPGAGLGREIRLTVGIGCGGVVGTCGERLGPGDSGYGRGLQFRHGAACVAGVKGVPGEDFGLIW